VAQALSFLLAGYETSGSTLTFALYELALHPEIQQSLRVEIIKVLSNEAGLSNNLRLIFGLDEVNSKIV
jgi:cytochrome P450 family 6